MARRLPEQLITMGRVAGSYGVHGWIRVRPWSGSPEALAQCRTWVVEGVEYAVEESKIHSGTLLARLAGIASRETAMKLKGSAVEVPRSALPEPEQGQYYWADLVGLEWIDHQPSTGDFLENYVVGEDHAGVSFRRGL